MRIIALILLAIALGAASPLGDADSDPVALITAIYQTYTDIAPGEDGTPDVQDVYSKRLQALRPRLRCKRPASWQRRSF